MNLYILLWLALGKPSPRQMSYKRLDLVVEIYKALIMVNFSETFLGRMQWNYGLSEIKGFP